MDEALYQSPIGILKLMANEEGIVSVEFLNDSLSLDNASNKLKNRHLIGAIQEFDRYFSGSLTAFQTPLVAKGTPFQKSVWRELMKLSSGSTTHYGAIAERIGNPKASRAVGLANNRNPLPIFIPCHRVVGKNGSLVGYAGDLWRKEWLLKHEGAIA